MSEFKTYHPIVNFTYFGFVIAFGCFFMHPVCLCISLVSGFTYSVMLKGKKAFKTNLMYMVPLFFVTAIINPLFNHQGVTVIGYLPSGNPLTFESIAYGLCSATMLVSVVCHFSCYNQIMTSDKFIYLFGKTVPAISLVISMTLRFVPRFTRQLKEVKNAQKCLGQNVQGANIIKRAKHGLKVLSIMVTWSLENAVDTADSMKSRGYGISGRTSFSVFTFDKRDKKALAYILILGLYTLAGYISGEIYFKYFPFVKQAEASFFGISVFTAYFLLCSSPIIIEVWEAIRWKALRSKV